jgi:NAD(P)-dependent dehydrogenase (short-subunit alcohol dehydrogenase family)
VANLDDLDRLFAQIKREKGKLDIVFANAGVAKYAPLGSITEDLYDSIFSINVKGSFSRCRRRCRCCRMEHLLS